MILYILYPLRIVSHRRRRRVAAAWQMKRVTRARPPVFHTYLRGRLPSPLHIIYAFLCFFHRYLRSRGESRRTYKIRYKSITKILYTRA